jgi:hypothetical protein
MSITSMVSTLPLEAVVTADNHRHGGAFRGFGFVRV